ncbi:MAG TPA: tetratricopeptide repeat protein, partial [Candidatus Omnitrophota bacterium]|nr:tetratricopeptide repeat protein [Candidatus Omnitrophota bacterium]
LPAVLQLLGKAVLPLNLNVFPTMHDTSVIYGIVAFISIASCLLLSKKKNSAMVVFGAAWFFLFLVPSLVRPHAGVINDVLEHRLYVPIIGLMVVFSEMDFLKNWRRWYAFAALCVILSFAALSMWRSDDFRDKLKFWERAVENSPNSPYAHLLLGVAHFDDGEGGRAEKEFQKAISLDPQMMRAHYYMGLVYMQDGQFPEASREFRKEISLHPEFDPSYSSLAVAYYKMGRREDIEVLWKRSIELNPGNLEAYKNLAIYYYNLGDIKSAKEYVRQLEDRGVTVPSDFLDALNASKGN